MNTNTKKLNKSPGRLEMELAATYLSQSEQNIGLDPVRVEQCLAATRRWKHNFKTFMTGKPALKTGVPLTKEDASAMADAIFLKFYKEEAEAREIRLENAYWTRDAGGVELGEDTSDPNWSYGKPWYPADEARAMAVKPRLKVDKEERVARMNELISLMKETHFRGQVLRRAQQLWRMGVIYGKDVSTLRRLANVLPRPVTE